MTAVQTDEFWERARRLQAERLRPEPAPPAAPRLDADMQELIRVLERLLTRPGPPDTPEGG